MGSGSSTQNPQLNVVSFSETFNLYYTSRFSQKTLDKIDDFIEHFEKYNLLAMPKRPSGLDWQGIAILNVPDSYENKAIEEHAGLINCGMPI